MHADDWQDARDKLGQTIAGTVVSPTTVVELHKDG